MDSYIEVDLIHSILVLFLSSLLAGYISLKPIKLQYAILYSTVISLYCACSWFLYAWIGYLMIEILFFVCLFRYRWSTYLILQAVRALLMLSSYAWYRGSFHLGIYCVPIYENPLLLWGILLLVIAGLLIKWKYFIARLNFVYECECYIENGKHIKCKGYLDSGNMLTSELVPVIFMDQKYESYFKDGRIELVVMNTMGAPAPVKCYEAMIKLQDQKSPIFICFRDKMKLPFDCEVLLNVNLMTG